MNEESTIWHLNIPKILHVYWGGETLSFIRYQTISSFIHHNPDWKVYFWYPKDLYLGKPTWETKELKYFFTCDNYIDHVFKLPIITIAFDFTHIIGTNNIPEVFKSDFLRLHLLSTIGGVWADMDIIFFKPMSFLYFNKKENENKNTFYCANHKKQLKHTTGFLLSAKNNAFFSNTLQLAINNFNSRIYQSVGPELFNSHFPTLESMNNGDISFNIDMNVVYQFTALQLLQNKGTFSYKAIGCHWYAGNPNWATFLQNTAGGTKDLPDCLMSFVLKNHMKWI